MAFGIIRAEKIKMAKIQLALQAHHQRESRCGEYSNPDIDILKSRDNVEFIHSDNFRESVNQKIKEHGITRKIRSDAVGMIDGLATVSGEFFKDKTKEQIVSYFKGMLPLIEKEFGPIISATLHCDEMKFNKSNYHLHFATVPIVKNENGTYSLSAKKIMGNQKDYIARQDRFHKQYFSKFGLQRGVSAKETNKKHIETNRWKAEQIQQLKNELKEDIEILEGDKQIVELETQIARKNLKQVSAKIDDFKKQMSELQENKHIIVNSINSLNDYYKTQKENVNKDITRLEQIINDKLNHNKYLDDLYENDYQYLDQALQVFEYLQEYDSDYLQNLFINFDALQQDDLSL